MTTSTRIYSIKSADGELVGLVEAANGPQALHHWARDQYRVDLANVNDGMQAALDGINVQRAKAKDE